MVRGFLATAAAIVFGATVMAFDGQHGHASAPAHPAQATPQGRSTASTSAASTHTTTRSSTPHTSTRGTTGSTTLSPVQQKVSSHTQLANKLQSRLPAGTNVVTAASGFRNLGQFVAAVNVSHNLGISFTQLKTDMVTKHMSLGQSIQALRPSANATEVAERAETEAKTEIEVETRTTTTKATAARRTSGGK